eukprot:COSAG02_NODE_28732_length_583_cov_1.673554_1_plen_87_part_10
MAVRCEDITMKTQVVLRTDIPSAVTPPKRTDVPPGVWAACAGGVLIGAERLGSTELRSPKSPAISTDSGRCSARLALGFICIGLRRG